MTTCHRINNGELIFNVFGKMVGDFLNNVQNCIQT
jgi:hypothetical protein